MSGARSRPLLVDSLCLAGLLGLTVLLRWPAFGTEGFHNEDAAGIAFNADLLMRGLLPLRDNVEYKAPGAFYIAWFSWEAFGRSLTTLVKVSAVWSWLAAVATWAGARTMYGRGPALLAALLYVLLSPVMDSIDFNYHAWMSAPYVGAGALFLVGLKRGGLAWFAGAGWMLATAALIKHQAALLVPAFGLTALLWARLPRPSGWAAPRPWPALFAGAGGMILGFLPLVILYTARGGLSDFIGTFFASEAGWRYVGGELDWSEKLARLPDGVQGLWVFMAVPTVLAAVAVVRAGRWRQPGIVRLWVALFFLMSFAGAALGFRFYKSYYLQVMPAALWLGVHPNGVLAFFRRERWAVVGRERLKRAVLPVVTAGLLIAAGSVDARNLGQARNERRVARDLDAQRVSKVIRENSKPDAPVWVWGRWAWPVYFHTQRRTASRYYKVLGILTTNLTNTWKRPTQNTRFVEDERTKAVSAEILADLKRERPPFLVVAPNEDYSKFKVFRDLLQKDYERVPYPAVRTLQLFRRKDVKLVKPPPGSKKPAAPPKKPAAPASKKPAVPKSAAAPASVAPSRGP